jgi:hypothetical protein
MQRTTKTNITPPWKGPQRPNGTRLIPSSLTSVQEAAAVADPGTMDDQEASEPWMIRKLVLLRIEEASMITH